MHTWCWSRPYNGYWWSVGCSASGLERVGGAAHSRRCGLASHPPNVLLQQLRRYKPTYAWLLLCALVGMIMILGGLELSVGLPAIRSRSTGAGAAADPYAAGDRRRCHTTTLSSLGISLVALQVCHPRLSGTHGMSELVRLNLRNSQKRLCYYRVLFGFGKLKFVGSGPKDSCYIKSFCIGMPLPTPIGWWVHHLPLVLHQAALAGMFAVEMFLPFALFVAGLPRWLAGFGILGLQIGIQLTGNFGYFNVLTSVLCIPSLLDPLDPGFNLLNQQSSAIQSAVSWILALSGLISLAFNSWCARAWPFWPALCPPADSSTSPRASSIVFKVADLFRLLVTFRLVHAYGVFPPHSSPPVRWVPIIEGLGRLPGEPKNSKLQWRRYRYKYMTSSATDGPNPAFIAPFHPRWAHAVFYESFGLNVGASLFC
eukprot:SAG31_NODE_450_length_15512_cov_5.788555_7_plen_426_part_00